MMTKEEREERWEKFKKLINNNDDLTIVIGELIAENAQLKALASNGESAIDTNGRLVEKIKELLSDRDRLNQRCEAYERAMYGDCKYCVNHYQCPERYDCRNEECVKFVGNTWQFNEARFMNGGGAK